LSVSLRGDYVIGRIPQLKVDKFFRAGFAVPPPPEAVISLTPTPNEGETVSFGELRRPGADPNTEQATGVSALPLELNGLELMLGIHFYF
jgi:hypothetical protein